MSDSEAKLRQGELVVTGRLIDASNATLLANCIVGNESIKCIYKPIAGERPLWDFQDGNLASREYAAFLISEMMQLHIVPTTILRDGPYGMGMVQEWIDIDANIDLADYFRQDQSQLRAMALFDAVINNTDRKIGHLLPQEDGKLYGCDHGVTFHEENKLRTVLWQWAGQDLSVDELNSLTELMLKLDSHQGEIFNTLLTTDEIFALRSRIMNLMDQKSFP
ncbi:MAG: phosphatidylinositol kinase, partial [Actinobacteria bacterium]|nr:phosphatidylinositol kinase [Actinomycetota bacterium]